MRPEFNHAHDPSALILPLCLEKQAGAGQDPQTKRATPRLTRSRLARPLLTSLGAITLLAGRSFVVVATSSTGSLHPWDWTRVNLSGAVDRYQVCDQQNHGLGTIRCMLSSGFRPASAAGAAASPHERQPLYSIATIQDLAPAANPKQGSRSTAPRGEAGSQHLVHFPPKATQAEVDSACAAAMKTALARGPAAVQEVEAECNPYRQPSPYASHDD
jgi:hypothetical protein